MRAFVLDADGWGPTDVPDPAPGPGQVVVHTTAAGICHSDLTLAARPPDAHPFPLPIVLGHELAGTVVEVSAGVDRIRVGDPVVGYGPRGCGACATCALGAENYCRGPHERVFPPGLGSDGALAEYVAVDASHLVVAPDVTPAQAAPLSDAGLTAFHALRRALGTGAAARSDAPTVIVMGVGGLGHAAVQLAKLAGATVVAVDRGESKRALATRLGADHVLAAEPALVEQVHELTAGAGADVVLDLVASPATLAQAAGTVGVEGVVSVVGVGSGRLPVGMHALPLGVRTDLPFWGTRPELVRLLDLAAAGRILLEVEEHPFGATAEAYARLDRGEVLGRAVVDPRSP